MPARIVDNLLIWCAGRFYMQELVAIMKRFGVLILLILSGCNHKDIKVRDLDFADYERESVQLNKVDTTYFIGKNPRIKWNYGELVSSYASRTTLNNWKFEDVGYVTYDSLGRLTSDNAKRYKDYEYSYDTSGVLNYVIFRDWDVRPKYNSTYRFYTDSLVMYQNWNHQGWQKSRPFHSHTSIFRFNNQGQVIHEFTDNTDNTGGIIKRTYKKFDYSNSQLKFKEEKVFIDDTLDYQQNMELFYSKTGILDSTVSKVFSKDDGLYKMVTFYDDKGLKSKSVLMDTIFILYRHIKRDD
jgi:hypothetical protein